MRSNDGASEQTSENRMLRLLASIIMGPQILGETSLPRRAGGRRGSGRG